METASTIPNRHIFIVDDDELFSDSIARNLLDAGFRTSSFSSGPSALQHISTGTDADLMLLDWKMPGMSGIDVLRTLRAQNISVPVIFLTVLSDQIYEEAGLQNGAVDFVEKSRSFSILLKRIELSLSTQRASDVRKDILTSRDLDITLRYDSRRAIWKGVAIDLTLTEFNILAHLVENSHRDVSYREIYDIVHGEGFVAGEGEIGYRANVRAFIKRIRQKFHDIDREFSLISNYPGYGYRWHDGRG